MKGLNLKKKEGGKMNEETKPFNLTAEQVYKKLLKSKNTMIKFFELLLKEKIKDVEILDSKDYDVYDDSCKFIRVSLENGKYALVVLNNPSYFGNLNSHLDNLITLQ